MPNIFASQELTVTWERQPEEPEHWYDRFYKYGRPLGYEFTVRRAYMLFRYNAAELGLTDILGQDAFDLWSDIAVKWQWEARAKAFAEAERVQRTVQWEKRRAQLADDDWDVGRALRDFAGQVLKATVPVKVMGTDEDGEDIVAPVMSPTQLIQVVKAASELQRLGAGQPTVITSQVENAAPTVYLPEVDTNDSSNA